MGDLTIFFDARSRFTQQPTSHVTAEGLCNEFTGVVVH
jgi:hypothetical protein